MNPHLSLKLKHLTFLSIIFVVFIHSFNSWPRYLTPVSFSSDWFNAASYLQMFISNGLARFVIPTLFMVSGYLLFLKLNKDDQHTYGKTVLRRLKTLLLPFIFWNLIVIGLLFLVTRLDAFSNVGEWWLNFTPERLFFNPDQPLVNFFTNPYNFPLWYLRDLFVFVLISPIFYFAFKTRYASIPLMLLLGALYIGELDAGNVFFLPGTYLFISLEGLFFFFLGGFFTRFAEKISKVKLEEKKPNPAAFLFLFAAFVLLATKTNLAFTLAEELDPLMATMLGLYKGSQILVMIAIWMVYDWFFPPASAISIKKKKYHLWQGAFLIYVIHAPLINVFMETFGHFAGHLQPPGTPYLALAVYFGFTLFFVALGIGLDFVLRKYLSPVHHWLTGGALTISISKPLR